MDNKIILASLAMDLKRAALGYWHGSNQVAERFLKEALKRKKEIDKQNVKPYISDLLEKLEKIKLKKNRKDLAEETLLYSTLFQNAALVG